MKIDKNKVLRIIIKEIKNTQYLISNHSDDEDDEYWKPIIRGWHWRNRYLIDILAEISLLEEE